MATTTKRKTTASTESNKKNSNIKSCCASGNNSSRTTSTSAASSSKGTKNIIQANRCLKEIKGAGKNNFPRQELLNWLSGRSHWDHQDWLSLLNQLKSKGFGHLTESHEGQAKIGEFLESNRWSAAS
ncbi:MAG: hypothetical protein HQK49_05910 [Oligoflexia bacterium]|nr:hypothetical protein [Oligoflexia bacterium]